MFYIVDRDKSYSIHLYYCECVAKMDLISAWRNT